MRDVAVGIGGAALVFWLGCLWDALRRSPDRYRCRISVDPSANKFIWIMIVLLMPLGSMCYLSMIPANREMRDMSGFHLGAFGTAFIPLVGWVFSMVFFFVGVQQSRRDRLSGTAVGGVGLLLAVAMSLGSTYLLRHVGHAVEGDRAKYSPWISASWLDQIGNAFQSYAPDEPEEQGVDEALRKMYTFLKIERIDLPRSELNRLELKAGDFIVHVDQMDIREMRDLKRAVKAHERDVYMVGVVRHSIGFNDLSYKEYWLDQRSILKIVAAPEVIPMALQVLSLDEYGACDAAGLEVGDIVVRSDTMPIYVSRSQFYNDAAANKDSADEEEFTVSVWRDGAFKDSDPLPMALQPGVDFQRFQMQKIFKLR